MPRKIVKNKTRVNRRLDPFTSVNLKKLDSEKKNPGYIQDLLKIVKGTGINLLGNIAWQLLGFVYVVILAKMLNTNDLGLYYLGITVINLVWIIAIAGTDTGIIRFVSIHHGAGNVERMRGFLASAFIIVIPLSIFIGISLFLSAGLISKNIFSKPALARVLKVLSLSLPFLAITSICLAATQAMKYMQYKVYCKDIANSIFKIIFVVVFYVLGFQLLGAVFAYIFSIVLVCIISIYFLAKVFPVGKTTLHLTNELKQLVTFSIPQTFSSLIYQITNMTDTLMLGYFALASDVGIYNITFKIVGLGSCILTSFNAMFSPVIADLYNQKKHENLVKAL